MAALGQAEPRPQVSDAPIAVIGTTIVVAAPRRTIRFLLDIRGNANCAAQIMTRMARISAIDVFAGWIEPMVFTAVIHAAIK
jgi:hypothetical protein